MADEITFQNDPVDPSVEFRKPHMAMAQRVSHHRGDAPARGLRCLAGHALRLRLAIRPTGLGDGDSIMLDGYEPGEGIALDGPGWHTLAVEEVPSAVLVRDGAVVRITEPAQHTGALDWDGAREWRPPG